VAQVVQQFLALYLPQTVVMALLATPQVLEALEEQFHLILELQIQQQQEDRVAQV
jgi:hypothetical protein